MIVLNSSILTVGLVMSKVCQSIHNVAFVLSDTLDRKIVMLEFFSFLFGIGIGITICNVI